MKSLLAAVSLSLLVSWTAAQAATLKIRCAGELDGNTTFAIETGAFESTVQGFARGKIDLPLDALTLHASMSMNRPIGSPHEQEPTFTMLLYRDGNPIQGQVNFARAQALDLDNRPAGELITLFGMNFARGAHAGVEFSRIDYRCTLTKLK